MSDQAAALIGVGALSLANLWLIVAMARRIRELGQQLARRAPQPAPGSRPQAGLKRGTAVPPFTVTTTSGAVVSDADLRGGQSLLGFFMPGCEPCHDQLPGFIAAARELPGGPARVLAVVAARPRQASGAAAGAAGAGGTDADHLVGDLAGVAQVILDPAAKALAAALAVAGYPSFFLIDADGRVEASAHGIPGLGALPSGALSGTR